MNRKIDKYLDKFKLKEPSMEIQHTIIANASQHWNDVENSLELSTGFKIGMKIFFSVAAMVTLSILCLNFIFSSVTEVSSMNEPEIKQLVKFGISVNRAEMINIMEQNKRSKFISYNQFFQED